MHDVLESFFSQLPNAGFWPQPNSVSARLGGCGDRASTAQLTFLTAQTIYQLFTILHKVQFSNTLKLLKR